MLPQVVRDHVRAIRHQWDRRPGAEWPPSAMDPTYVPPIYRLARWIERRR